MKLIPLLFMLVLSTSAMSQYTYNQLNVNLLEKANDAKAYTFENLRLYPVHAKDGFIKQFKNVGRYLPLPEAIKKKKVRITEKNSSGSVNNLTIENIGTDTIIVICGDVVKGGKQDRIVEEDMLVAPKSGKKDMKVFCVESGRWTDNRQTVVTRNRNNNVRSTSPSTPPSSSTPVFNDHYNKGSMSLRKVVEKDKDQSKVWAKVEEINVKNVTTTETKTYTALENSGDYSKKLKQYIAFFNNKFSTDSTVIGVVVVSGNKVLGCDLFATPVLFRSQFPSLLYSYATEAIVSGQKVSATPSIVKTYTDSLMKDEASQKVVVQKKGSAFINKGRKLRVSSFD
jgi:hypothetical protein